MVDELELQMGHALLGVTIHCGEEGDVAEISEVLEFLKPDRIGHGVLAATVPDLLAELAGRGVTLEVCPTSNLRTGVFESTEDLAGTVRRIARAGVGITISTDGPVMMGTSLREEMALLIGCGALGVDEVRAANDLAHATSFCPRQRR